MRNCKCAHIRGSNLDRDTLRHVVYTIEKLYPDDKYRNYPQRIHICDKVYNNKIFDPEKFLCDMFGEDTYYKKHYVKEYFSNYKWSETSSVNVRKLLGKIPTICLGGCLTTSSNRQKFDNKNSGIILVGDKYQLSPISDIFNDCITKTEFVGLSVHGFDDLVNFKRSEYNHTIERVLKSGILSHIGNYFTLLGSENNGFNRERLSFSFGKREYYYGYVEDSFECAKREFFEEYNIQISPAILDHSKNLSKRDSTKPARISDSESVLFFIYLPPILFVEYHKESDTIYIDTENVSL